MEFLKVHFRKSESYFFKESMHCFACALLTNQSKYICIPHLSLKVAAASFLPQVHDQDRFGRDVGESYSLPHVDSFSQRGLALIIVSSHTISQGIVKSCWTVDHNHPGLFLSPSCLWQTTSHWGPRREQVINSLKHLCVCGELYYNTPLLWTEGRWETSSVHQDETSCASCSLAVYSFTAFLHFSNF